MIMCEICGSKFNNEFDLNYDSEEDMDFCPNCGEGDCFIDLQ